MKIHQVHKLVVHNVVNFAEKYLYPPSNQNVMYKPFVYGTSVYSIAKGCRSTCSGIPFTSEKFRRLTEYQIYAPDSIKLASPFQKGTLKIFAAESNVILRMFSNALLL